MPQYECAVVISTTLSDEQIQEQIEAVKGWLVGIGAQVTAVDVWGRKRLAYPIRKQPDGFYVIYYFTLNEGLGRLDEFEKRLNTAETVLRHLLVRLPALKETPRVPKEAEEAPSEEKAEAKAEPEPKAEEKAPAEVEAPAETTPVLEETEPPPGVVEDSTSSPAEPTETAPEPAPSQPSGENEAGGESATGQETPRSE